MATIYYIPDAHLVAIVGTAPISAPDVVRKLWAYIKTNGLVDKKKKHMINFDNTLKAVFGRRKQVTMFEFIKFMYEHLSALPPEAESDIYWADTQLSKVKKTQQEALIKSRLGQGVFRERLRRLWDNKCAVTGYKVLPLLRASHIKPWRKATNSERLDPCNGLLLIPNLDAAFDAGLLSFTTEGTVLLSKKQSPRDVAALGIKNGMALRKLPRRTINYLKYHRKHVFQR